jgi:hypothetical protein
MWDERTKCDKCGKVIVGGRIKLLQHKKDSILTNPMILISKLFAVILGPKKYCKKYPININDQRFLALNFSLYTLAVGLPPRRVPQHSENNLWMTK